MIAQLTGRVEALSDGTCVIDVGGDGTENITVSAMARVVGESTASLVDGSNVARQGASRDLSSKSRSRSILLSRLGGRGNGEGAEDQGAGEAHFDLERELETARYTTELKVQERIDKQG